MASYLTLAAWRLRTTMPPGSVDALVLQRPGFLELALEDRSEELHEILSRRYAVPFELATAPRTLLRWVALLVTYDAYCAIGYDPSSEQDALIKMRADEALVQARAAADAELGLYELPLRNTNPNGSGVTKGGPFFYAEASPYFFLDAQREAIKGGWSR